MLINLARKAFEDANWRTTIDTGRYMYPLAENIRNVADVGVTEDQDSFVKRQALLTDTSKL